jgi:hypothetical protein
MSTAKKLQTKRTDPHVDAVMERLFEGRDSEAFVQTIRCYVAWRTDSEAADEEYLSREEFTLGLDQLIEGASEQIREDAESDRGNDYHEEDSWEAGGA